MDSGRCRSGGSSSKRGSSGRGRAGSGGSWGGSPGTPRLGRNPDRSRWCRRSRFFLSQGEFEGLGAGLEEEVAELELGSAEGAPFIGHEVAGDSEEFVSEGLLEVGGQLLGAGFLVRGERCRGHGRLRGSGRD